MNQCTIEGCTNPHRSRGLCSMHYMRSRRQGDPNAVGKAGRPTHFFHDILREMLPEVSPRTRTKINMTMSYLDDAFGSDLTLEVLKLIGKRRTNAYRSNYTAQREDACNLHAIHCASIGRWSDSLNITAADFLQIMKEKHPHLVKIYSDFKS